MKPGTKCKVWGRKSSKDKCKIAYFALSKHGINYFINDKKAAELAGQDGVISGFLGAFKGLQEWSNFEVID